MPKICYVPHTFSTTSLAKIQHASAILDEYAAQGYILTLRQLYYQFVARALIANTQREYKNLGAIINDARLAGLLDWDQMEDRTRNLAALPHWDSPADIVAATAQQFRVDRWENQPNRVEVWIEKEALAGIFAGVCARLDVPYFSCRGYTSQSEMWAAAQRLIGYQANAPRGKRRPKVTVLHFGDHDPSGMDMTRDIIDRLDMFTGPTYKVTVQRLALNMAQVEQYDPPPNPAKETDSRHGNYAAEFGGESWELDALEPAVLVALVETAVAGLTNRAAWDRDEERQAAGRKSLRIAAANWESVEQHLEDSGLTDE